MYSSFQLKLWRREAEQILKKQAALMNCDAQQLQQKIRTLHWQVRSAGPQRHQLQDVFALGVEAARRTTGMTHYPVQIMGGIALIEGQIAEMQTGEGKTLTATLPAAFRAFAGKGAHVVTANDYLAERDAENMRPVYSLLGLSVGCIKQEMEDDDRRKAYSCDITYGTATEMGFDFLRDRLKTGARNDETVDRSIFSGGDASNFPVQRGHYFALIDEADCILIDEARTPLIIGVARKNRDAMVQLYRWCAASVSRLEINRDFLYEPRKRQADLTEMGCRRVSLLPKPVLLDSISTENIFLHIEKALTARMAYERDRDYVVHEQKIVIVDEGTGRKMEGRQWQAGLHQSVEAKERLEISDQTGSAARISIQSFFRIYQHLCGMTGTAYQARREFRRVYRLSVNVIPPNRPRIQRIWPARAFVSMERKYAAIMEEVKKLTREQRAVLIGTPSVDASEELSNCLKKAGIIHIVLNARFPDIEADIVAKAGTPGRVTIATNMAGRGTDILLNEIVRQQGGLHVIATEMHTSKRIDRQLIGRAGRQGDPGSAQFFLSLEDELLRAISPERQAGLKRQARPDAKGELDPSWVSVFIRIQRSLERMNTKQRKQLLQYEKQHHKKLRRIGLDPNLEVADD